MLYLHLHSRRLNTKRVSVSNYVHTSIFTSRSNKRCMVTHTSKQSTNHFLKNIRVRIVYEFNYSLPC